MKVMIEVLKVSPSGYYDWVRRKSKVPTETKRLELLQKIEEIHQGSRGTYGSPRVFKVLKGLGEKCSKSTVERLMKQNKIRAKTKRKFKVTTDSKHNLPVAPNILERNFSPANPNEVWTSDLTYSTPSHSKIVERSRECLSMFGIRKFSRKEEIIDGSSLRKNLSRSGGD